MSKTVISVVSTAIDKLIYDDTRQDLLVKFNSKKVYVYTPVSNDFFDKLKNANSIGQYFNKHIKNNEALTCLKLIK